MEILEIRSINIAKRALRDWKKQEAEEKEMERKEWWNELMPFKVYKVPEQDEG